MRWALVSFLTLLAWVDFGAIWFMWHEPLIGFAVISVLAPLTVGLVREAIHDW